MPDSGVKTESLGLINCSVFRACMCVWKDDYNFIDW